MKKISTLLTLLFLATNLFSQTDISKTLGDFDELKVYKGLKVKLVKSTEQKIEIVGPKSEDVVVKNKNGTLKISMNLSGTFEGKYADITVFYNKPIAELDANGGGVIISDETIKQTKIELNAQEGAYIKLKVAIDYLKIKGVSGGSISLTGKTKSQNVTLNTGATFEAHDLISEQTIISSATGARATVHATEALEAKVTLGGTIAYVGTPIALETEKVLGGKIEEYTAKEDAK